MPFLLLLILAAVACRPSGRPPSSLVITVDSAAGFPVVRSTGSPPAWLAVPGPAVGTSDGGPTEFGSVRSVLLARDGFLYVVDDGYRRIAIFDSAGSFQGMLGREGAGPAEYRDPYSIAWLGDTLAVLDPANSRIGLFRRDGGWAGAWQSPRITGDQFIRFYRTGDSFWAYQPQGVFIRYTAHGPSDTMLVARPAHRPPVIQCDTPDGGLSSFSTPFAPAFIAIPTPDRRQLVVNTDQYRLIILAPSGDTTLVIERPIDPTPIVDAEWDSGGASWRTFRDANPTARCDGAGFERPPSKPPVAFAFFDDVGHLWVEVVTPTGPRFDVFELSGRLLASVFGLPATGGVDPTVGGTRMAFVTADSTGAPIVRLYRIDRSPP